MAKTSPTWRWSESLLVPLQASLILFCLVVLLFSTTYSLLPKRSWSESFTSLLFNVTSYVSSHNDTITPTLRPTDSTAQSPVNEPGGGLATELSTSIAPEAPDRGKVESTNGFSATDLELSLPPMLSPGPTDLSVFAPDTFKWMSPAPSIEHPWKSPSEAPPAQRETAHTDEREKFLIPLLSNQVGAGNQLMEYISAAVMARALNRTLCLSPFWPGPMVHAGRSVRLLGGLSWEDRYDVTSLSRFTRTTSMDNCLSQCHHTLDANWLLKPSRQPWVRDWKKYPLNNESWNLDWSYVKWQSPADITATLGSYTDHCVGLAGLFPGLRWRGAFLAVSAFLQPANHILAVTNALQEHAVGTNTPFLAVHWRFEESECGHGHQVGLCFVRCSDGAVIDSGLHPEGKEWFEVSKVQCNRDGHFRGVALDRADVLEAIYDRAQNHSLKTVYLATDGWLRGPGGPALVKYVVEMLRKRALTVVGLWKISELPNFADGTYFDPLVSLGKSNQINGQQIALVEQEMCARSAVFLGSSQSTWSLAVFRLRLARRRTNQILQSRKLSPLDQKARDELVIETLVKDEHAAGLHCRYSRYYDRAKVNQTVETDADEYPDGWLDLDACEGRVGRGGHCQVAKCF